VLWIDSAKRNLNGMELKNFRISSRLWESSLLEKVVAKS
jgi:hypothetical protein